MIMISYSISDFLVRFSRAATVLVASKPCNCATWPANSFWTWDVWPGFAKNAQIDLNNANNMQIVLRLLLRNHTNSVKWPMRNWWDNIRLNFLGPILCLFPWQKPHCAVQTRTKDVNRVGGNEVIPFGNLNGQARAAGRVARNNQLPPASPPGLFQWPNGWTMRTCRTAWQAVDLLQ